MALSGKGADDAGTGCSIGADRGVDDIGSICEVVSMIEESIGNSVDGAVYGADVGSRSESDLALFPMVSTAPTSIPTVTLSAAAVIAIPARRCTAPTSSSHHLLDLELWDLIRSPP